MPGPACRRPLWSPCRQRLRPSGQAGPAALPSGVGYACRGRLAGRSVRPSRCRPRTGGLRSVAPGRRRPRCVAPTAVTADATTSWASGGIPESPTAGRSRRRRSAWLCFECGWLAVLTSSDHESAGPSKPPSRAATVIVVSAWPAEPGSPTRIAIEVAEEDVQAVASGEVQGDDEPVVVLIASRPCRPRHPLGRRQRPPRRPRSRPARVGSWSERMGHPVTAWRLREPTRQLAVGRHRDSHGEASGHPRGPWRAPTSVRMAALAGLGPARQGPAVVKAAGIAQV